MIIIGVGSFVVGIAPTCFVSRVRYLQQKLLLSCTLCFGGGVLFATSILHMLPEIRESMINYAELLFSCGFLLLYLIDECVHYFWGSNEHVLQLHQSRYETNGIWNNGNEVYVFIIYNFFLIYIIFLLYFFLIYNKKIKITYKKLRKN